MSEPIVIIFQTYQRTGYALLTIEAAVKHLRYDGPLLWYVADDGSNEWHPRDVVATLERLGQTIVGFHAVRRGYGGNANVAWEAARQISPLSLWLEDDWQLSEDLDLWPYAALLMSDPNVGMVRLGYLNPGLRGEIISRQDRLWLDFEREPTDGNQYVFTGHPSLRHTRYWEAYGEYPTGLIPGDTELAYAYQYRIGAGPKVVWPLDYPPGSLFSHIGSIKTETML
jgi:hypothetical protein